METDAWGPLLDTSAAVCCKPGNLASAPGSFPRSFGMHLGSLWTYTGDFVSGQELISKRDLPGNKETEGTDRVDE